MVVAISPFDVVHYQRGEAPIRKAVVIQTGVVLAACNIYILTDNIERLGHIGTIEHDEVVGVAGAWTQAAIERAMLETFENGKGAQEDIRRQLAKAALSPTITIDIAYLL